MKRVMRAFILVSISLLIFGGNIFSRDFVILGIDAAPFKYYEKSKMTGILIDILKEMTEELGIKPKFDLLTSDARIIEEMKKGRADMAMMYSKKSSRMDFFSYPEETFIELSWHFFVRKGEEKGITYNSFNDLKGLTVGAVKKVAYTPEFWKSGLDLEIVARYDLPIRMLLAKRIDTVPLPTVITLFQEKQSGNIDKITYLPKPLKSKPYFNVFSKASNHPDKKKFMENYNDLVKKMRRNGVLKKVFEKYLGKGNVDHLLK